MKKLVLASTVLFAFSCGKLDKTLDKINTVPEKIDGFSAGLDKVNEKTQLQAISEAETKLLDEENLKEGTPIPFKMMGPAQVMASFLSSEQALNWVKLKLATINTAKYTGAADDLAAETAFNFKKKGLLTAVTFVAGFLPEKTMNEIVDSQIKHSGYYQSTALAIVYLKAKFTNDVLLGSVLSESFTTLGHTEHAMALNSQIEAIENLPFASHIKVDITGFTAPQMNQGASGVLGKKSGLNWTIIKKLASEGFEKSNSLELASADKSLKIDKAAFDELMKKLDVKIQAASKEMNNP